MHDCSLINILSIIYNVASLTKCLFTNEPAAVLQLVKDLRSIGRSGNGEVGVGRVVSRPAPSPARSRPRLLGAARVLVAAEQAAAVVAVVVPVAQDDRPVPGDRPRQARELGQPRRRAEVVAGALYGVLERCYVPEGAEEQDDHLSFVSYWRNL